MYPRVLNRYVSILHICTAMCSDILANMNNIGDGFIFNICHISLRKLSHFCWKENTLDYEIS